MGKLVLRAKKTGGVSQQSCLDYVQNVILITPQFKKGWWFINDLLWEAFQEVRLVGKYLLSETLQCKFY